MNTNQKIEEVELEIIESKNQVQSVIINVLERGDKLEQLQDKSDKLMEAGNLFNKQAKKVERKMCCQKLRTNMMLIGIIVAIIVILAIILGVSIPHFLK